MFFVGGDDDKNNNAAAGTDMQGGVTKAKWDALVAAADVATALSTIMEPNGDAIITELNVTTEDAGFGFVRFIGFPGIFAGAEIGMIAYITETVGTPISGNDGLYTITGIDVSDRSFILIEAIYNAGDPGKCTVAVGGAWDSVAVIADGISSADHTQEIHTNKDFTYSGPWDWSIWGYGDADKNTWLRVLGFSRLPGDIVDQDGAFHQTPNDAKVNGIDTTKWVNIDLDATANDFILPESSENIQLSGFRSFNQGAGNWIMASATSIAWKNVEIYHCAFDLSYNGLDFTDGTRLLVEDNYFYASGALDSKFAINSGSGYAKNNIFDFAGKKVIGFQVPGDFCLSGNLMAVGWISVNPLGTVFVIYENNTFSGPDQNLSVLRTNGGFIISYDNILMPANLNQTAFQMTASGGSVISKNDCVFGEDGNPLTNVMENLIAGGEATSNVNTLEEDPLLDINNIPANLNLRGDDGQYIGAMQTLPEQTTAPVITSLTDGGDGSSLVAAVTGTGTIQLYYKTKNASSWTIGETRSGDGNITQTGLTTGWYECYATAADADVTVSGASNIKTVHIASTTAESIEAAIVAILEGDIGVTSLVDKRIYPLTVPQGVSMPAITYQQLNDNGIQTHGGQETGANSFLNTRMQIDCWSDVYTEASALKKAVRLALVAFIGTVAGIKISNIILENSTDLDRQVPGTDKLKRYSKSLDFIIVFNEPSS